MIYRRTKTFYTFAGCCAANRLYTEKIVLNCFAAVYNCCCAAVASCGWGSKETLPLLATAVTVERSSPVRLSEAAGNIPSSGGFAGGVHDKDAVSVLVGNLLQDGHAEKRGNATRLTVHMSSKNAEYCFWLHTFFKEKGYCSPQKPKIIKQIGKNNTIYFSIKFRTFSFSSLNWLYDAFYIKKTVPVERSSPVRLSDLAGNSTSSGGFAEKTIPVSIDTLLTEKALAIWFMDDPVKTHPGLRLCTQCFSYENHVLLQKALFKNFSLRTNIQRSKDKYVLYIEKKDKPLFSEIVKPHMLNCMLYKLN